MASMQELLEKYPSMKKFEDEEYEEFNDGRELLLLRHIFSSASLPTLRSNPSAICAVMDHYAAHTDFLINIGPDKAHSVASLIHTHAPSVIVELGGYVGYSAIWFADAQFRAWEAAGAQGARPRYWSLEADPVFAAVAMALVDLAGLSDVVEVVVGNADESLRRLKQEEVLRAGGVDMLFLDHVEELYDVDLKVAWEELGLLRKGALVLADNVLKPGAPRYREFVRGHEGLSTRVIKGLIIPGDAEDELDVSTVL